MFKCQKKEEKTCIFLQNCNRVKENREKGWGKYYKSVQKWVKYLKSKEKRINREFFYKIVVEVRKGETEE